MVPCTAYPVGRMGYVLLFHIDVDSLAMPCDGDDDEYSNTILCFLAAASIHILLTFHLLLLPSLYPYCNPPS